MGPQRGSGRAIRLALAGCCLAAVACQQPKIGSREVAVEEAGPAIVITGAWMGPQDRVVATFSLSRDGSPVVGSEATALQPRFTVATLSPHPVDGLPAWKSHVLTGSQVAPILPLTPPGTPDPAVVVTTSARQPGAETPAAGSIVELGGGDFLYTLASPIVARVDTETIRVGAWLNGAAGTSRTSSTFDFRPDGGAPQGAEPVLDERCASCHETLLLHGRRSGVRLCATCHTWQCVDPDTVDPASVSATAATDPNPLELGRLVHRIHRGKNLPTLYRSSSTAVPAPPLNAGLDLPLPFSPESSTTALVGRKYSVVGYSSRELVFGRVVQRIDNGQPVRTVATGVVFPRDLRDCSACHGEPTRRGYEATRRISRRTCSGCHPDTWYGDAAKPITDEAHFAHPGGPQRDDLDCGGCHLEATPAQQKVYVPIAEAHVVPAKSPRYNEPRIEIVDVRNLYPGGAPKITFRLADAHGPMTPGPDPTLATTSLVPGRLERLRITIAGPTSPDYGALPLSSAVAPNKNALLVEPGGLATTAVSGEYVYTFSSPLPLTAGGTWAIGMEARRRVKVAHYDKDTDTFRWPYTGETVTESPDNPVVYADTSWGTWPSPVAAPRRAVVSEAKCLKCHDRIEFHGAQRHQVEYCLLCHSPEATDWAARPKKNGVVDLAATVDGIEERSIHLKVMLHRIHTGGRTGAASLEALEPLVIYGYGMRPLYFDEGIFPADLANCTLCHEGKSYLVESVPPDAPATVANETATIRHKADDAAHASAEKRTLPIQASCLGCHANGGTLAHVASKTVSGTETCAQCHAKGALSVEVAHGLAPRGTSATASFSAIAQQILVPRCATAACHAGSPPVAFPQLDADAAYAALVGQPSQQAPGMKMVEPGAPDRSYLLFKLRGEAGSVGGTPATPMPIFDALLDPADLAAIEAWIANGAQND